MESQLQRPYDHGYEDPQDEGFHSVVEDEGEQHNEKKSVLKKVKAKAKKIKDTLKKHGHDHEHDHDEEHGYHHPDHDEEEEEDEDEEMAEDPEIHGSPIYESPAIRSHDINLEKPSAVGEDRYDPKRSDEVLARLPHVSGQEQYSGQSEVNLGRPTAVPEDKNVSFSPQSYGTNVSNLNVNREKEENMGQHVPGIGVPEGLDEDPHAPKNLPGAVSPSNYETKVADPTGKGEEAEITPLIRSFDKMGVSDESVSKSGSELGQKGFTGSHDQFAPQSNPTADEFAPKPSNLPTSQDNHPESTPSYDRNKPEDLDRDTLSGKSSDESGYAEKISTATSVIADKAISAKNVVASKLGYGGSDGSKAQEKGESEEAAKSASPGSDGSKAQVKGESEGAAKSGSPTEYAHKVAATVAEKLTPVYEKVAYAGSSAVSKVKGTGTRAEGETERPETSIEGSDKVADKGVSVKEYLAEKLKPSEEDKALSEVISDALHKKKEESGKPRMGKVTESEEVARQLGTGKENRREGDDARAAGSESSGKGVVDRLKNAVNSWVGKGGDQAQYSSHESNEGIAAGETVDPGNAGREERKLQESAN